MGNVIRMCTRGEKKVREFECGDAMPKDQGKEKTNKDKNNENKGHKNDENWESELLRKNIDESPFITHAAILNLADGSIRTSVPTDFGPDEEGVLAILTAFGPDGDTSKLAESGLIFWKSTFRLDSFDEERIIICSDEEQGGCILEKTEDAIVLLVFKQGRDEAAKVTNEIARNIEDRNY